MSRSIVVVPTYNEVQNLPVLVERIVAVGDFDVLVVDDGSPDGTGEVAEQLAATHGSRISVIHRRSKSGIGQAYVAGFRAALNRAYEYVFQMDADLSHDPTALPALRAALEDVDVAIGSRYVAGGGTVGWPLKRKVLSSVGSLYARLLLGVPVRDLTGGFKGFRRRALEAVDLDSIGARGFGFQIEVNYLLHRRGFRLAEVPIVFSDRQVGKSKMGLPIVVEALVLPWQLRLAGRRAMRLQPSLAGEPGLLRAAVASLRLAVGGRQRNRPLA